MNTLAAVAALLLSLPAAPAPSLSSLNLDFLTRKADLVFAGVVQSVERVLDERSGRETMRFVTFEQLEVLAGRYDKNFLTLYFEWFPPEHLPADYLGPRPPDFREGEEVVVFATAGNGETPCPTVLMDRGVLKLSRIDALDEPRVVLPGKSIRSDPADATLGWRPTISLTELKAVIASARLDSPRVDSPYEDVDSRQMIARAKENRALREQLAREVTQKRAPAKTRAGTASPK